jgi:hypothetical protein
MKTFGRKRIAYVVSQGMVTATSAIIVVVLSSQGDNTNVIKFGIYFSLLAILQSTLSLRYELGIYTDGGRNKHFSLYTAVMNSFLLSIILAIGVILLKYFNISIWNFTLFEAVLIALACGAANICMVLKQYYVVRGDVDIVTKINIISTILIFITLFLAQFTPIHLVFYLFLFMYVAVYGILIIHWLASDKLNQKYTLIEYREELIRGSDFVKFSTPGILVNVLGQNILILYFGVVGNSIELAQLVVIMRVIFLPLSLLSLPLSHVISTEVMNYVANGKAIFGFLCSVISILLTLTLLYVFALLVIDVHWLRIVGIEAEYWNNYLPLLIILVLFRMTISPVSNVLNVLKKEKLLFNLQLVNALTIGALFLVGPQHVADGLWLYSAGSVLFQASILIFILRSSHLFDKYSDEKRS